MQRNNTAKAKEEFKIGMKELEDFPSVTVRAIKHFKLCLILDPSMKPKVIPHLAKCYYSIGVKCYEFESSDKGLEYFQKCVDIDPNSRETICNYLIKKGDAYSQDKSNSAHIGLADQCYHDASVINPKSAKAYFKSGVLYQKTGHKKDAHIFFKNAIHANPEYKLKVESFIKAYKQGEDAIAKAKEPKPHKPSEKRIKPNSRSIFVNDSSVSSSTEGQPSSRRRVKKQY